MLGGKRTLATISIFFSCMSFILMVLAHSTEPNQQIKTLAKVSFFLAVLLLNLIALKAPSEPFASCSARKGAGVKQSARPLVVCLSADSWCGYSKKISSEKDKISNALKRKGIDFVLISDGENKDKFDQIAQVHKVDGFPHSILLVNGKKVHEIPGYLPHEQFVEAIASKV